MKATIIQEVLKRYSVFLMGERNVFISSVLRYAAILIVAIL